MIVHTLRALKDNFIFAVEANGEVMVVDPGEAAPVEDFLARKKLKLAVILATHCHNDHIGGVKELTTRFQPRIYGPSRLGEHGIKVDLILEDSSSFTFHNLNWTTIALPGHTLDHLGYFEKQTETLFCGDVLFSLGCGRLFEGTFEQGYQSLQKLKGLPANTRIFCAHEYTLSNCVFHIKQKIAPAETYEQIKRSIEEKLKQGSNTIPTSLGFELQYNIFLKSRTLEEFKEYRERKNQS